MDESKSFEQLQKNKYKEWLSKQTNIKENKPFDKSTVTRYVNSLLKISELIGENIFAI